jgi:hypothetical protein
MSLARLARRKIEQGAAATKQMDDLLEPALNALISAIRDGNGAGIYYDLSRVRSALTNARVAIDKALEIERSTAWPSNEDYDR